MLAVESTLKGEEGCAQKKLIRGHFLVLTYFKHSLLRHLSGKNQRLDSPFLCDNDRQGDLGLQNDLPVIREAVVMKDAVGTCDF